MSKYRVVKRKFVGYVPLNFIPDKGELIEVVESGLSLVHAMGLKNRLNNQRMREERAQFTYWVEKEDG